MAWYRFHLDSDHSNTSSPTSSEDLRATQEPAMSKRKRILADQRKTLIMDLFQKCGSFFPAQKDIDDFLVWPIDKPLSL